MSLVNDMLRDLEARGAASGGHRPFLDMQAVDEAAATRRQRAARLRRWVPPPLVGVALVAAASLVLFERFSPIPAVPDAPADAAMTAAVPATRLLDVLPQQDGGRFVLQLLLDRSISYQRTDEGGAISLRLPDVTLAGGPQSGRVESNGLSLS